MIEIKRPTILPPPSLVLLSFSFLSSFPLCLVSSPSFLDSGKAHVCAWCVPSCQSQDSNRVIEHMGSLCFNLQDTVCPQIQLHFWGGRNIWLFPFPKPATVLHYWISSQEHFYVISVCFLFVNHF